MKFFTSPIFYITVLLQIAGPYFFSIGDWANVIQYLSGFGMAYALWDFERKWIHLNKIHKEVQHARSNQ